jgi:hypothetical protein
MDNVETPMGRGRGKAVSGMVETSSTRNGGPARTIRRQVIDRLVALVKHIAQIQAKSIKGQWATYTDPGSAERNAVETMSPEKLGGGFGSGVARPVTNGQVLKASCFALGLIVKVLKEDGLLAFILFN